MELVQWTADGRLHCGGCGRTVRADYESQDPAPCGCAWHWVVRYGQPVLRAVPSRLSWWPGTARTYIEAGTEPDRN